MKPIYLFALVLVVFTSCQHTPASIKNAESTAIVIDSTWDCLQDSAYAASLIPIKEQMEKELDVVIGYAPGAMSVGRPESTLSNWAAEVLRQTASQLTSRKIDIGIINMGGLRCEWAAGNITKRKVFELMPFDNTMHILTLTGETISELCNNFAQVGGEGISGLRMNIKNGQAQDIFIAGKPLIPEAHYTVAVSDYLALGNDNMEPLTKHIDQFDSGKFIRDIFIDFIEQKTANNEPIASELDGRITILE